MAFGLSQLVSLGRRNDLVTSEVTAKLLMHGRVEYAAKELGVREGKLRSFMKKNAIPEDLQEQAKSATGALVESLGDDINQFLANSIPDTQRERFALASKYAAEDDLVGDLVDKSVELAVFGMGIRAVGKETKREKAEKEATRVAMYQTTLAMFEHAFKYDNVVILEHQKLGYVMPIPLENLLVLPTYGYSDGQPLKKVYMKLSDDFVKAFRRGRIDSKSVPPHWVAAMRKGTKIDGQTRKNWVELREDKGEHVTILNPSGKRDRLVNARMRRIFPHIALRRVKIEGEFSIDYHIKHLIHQIVYDKGKTGANSKNPLANLGPQTLRVTPEELTSVIEKYREMAKTLTEATGPEISHEFHGPEFLKYSPPQRYQKIEEMIERHFGFSRVFTVGDGGNYSSAYVFTKGLIARIERWRELIGMFWEDYLFRKTKADASIGFSRSVLKEAKQALDEIKYGRDNGLISPQTATEELGWDVEFENQRKEEAMSDPLKYLPVFESSQGITAAKVWGIEKNGSPDGDGDPGAPAGDGPQSNKEGQPEEPAPSD